MTSVVGYSAVPSLSNHMQRPRRIRLSGQAPLRRPALLPLPPSRFAWCPSPNLRVLASASTSPAASAASAAVPAALLLPGHHVPLGFHVDRDVPGGAGLGTLEALRELRTVAGSKSCLRRHGSSGSPPCRASRKLHHHHPEDAERGGGCRMVNVYHNFKPKLTSVVIISVDATIWYDTPGKLLALALDHVGLWNLRQG